MEDGHVVDLSVAAVVLLDLLDEETVEQVLLMQFE